MPASEPITLVRRRRSLPWLLAFGTSQCFLTFSQIGQRWVTPRAAKEWQEGADEGWQEVDISTFDEEQDVDYRDMDENDARVLQEAGAKLPELIPEDDESWAEEMSEEELEEVQALRAYSAQERYEVAPGIYVARTAIRLRTEPSQDADFTGDVVKDGEIFEITEAIPTDDPKQLAFVKLGDRGWIFDVGIAGPWIGVPIIARITDVQQQIRFKKLLRTPTLYEQYQQLLDQPEDEAEDSEEDLAAYDAAWVDLKQVVEAKIDVLDENDKTAFEKLCEDEDERRLIMSCLRQAGDPARKLAVLPKWMKMSRLLPPQMKCITEKDRQHYTTLPGGRDGSGLAFRRSDTGRRMGIRIPSSCSPL